MITATQVAAYIESQVPSAWWKTQKLVYLAQAWSLGINGRKIFPDTIEAWRDGPVVRGLYATQGTVRCLSIGGGALDDDAKSVIDAVLSRYGQMTSIDLINLTHEDKPWQEARGDVPARAATSTPIDMDAVKRVYVGRALSGTDVPAVRVPMVPADDVVAAEAGRRVVEVEVCARPPRNSVRQRVTVEQAIALHDTMESAPVIDRGKLEAAIGRAYQGWGDTYFYPSVFSQAAVLMHGIAAAHAFLDGNKRTAWATAMVALEMNGVSVRRIDDESMASYMEQVALHVHTVPETAFMLATLVE